MENYRKISPPKAPLNLINQLFEIEKKVSAMQEKNSVQRNLDKLKDLIENELFRQEFVVGFTYHDPLGETYSETRTDCEAVISCTATDKLVIAEVIKPTIYCIYSEAGQTMKVIVQKAVVVAAGA